MYIQTNPWKVNYDEKEIPPYTLPEVLCCQDGTRVSTPEEWRTKRRPELLKLFRELYYGDPPPMPDRVTATLLTEKKDARGGLAIRREIRLDFIMNSGLRHSAVILLYLPAKAKGPVPVAVNLTFGGNQVITEETDVMLTGLLGKQDEKFDLPASAVRRYPIDYLMKRGYALAVASYNDFFPDRINGWGASIYELFRPKEEFASGRLCNASAISAWAWGLSRMLDYLQSVPEIDPEKALCIGHSRLGKTSLWAGAQDERFKVVCVNDSGCGGAALDRRLYGETLFGMSVSGPAFAKWWFSEKLAAFAGHPETLPVDQHELIALVAPRKVAVHSATLDQWADPKSEYLSAFHAGPAFALFGQKPLTSPEPPAPDTPVGSNVSYLLRTGGHDLLLADWQQYIDIADSVFNS